jgi:hypothetical protein
VAVGVKNAGDLGNAGVVQVHVLHGS